MRLASLVRWATRGGVGLLLAALVIASPASGGPGGSGNSAVVPPNAKPYGLSYGEWAAAHWQWLYSMPVDHHPLFDTADCSANQAGAVWFLGGTFASTEIVPGVIVGQVTRECTIPAGKALFFPIVDAEASTIELNGTTEAELREVAQFFADFIDVDSLFCEIDGKSVGNLATYRAQSPLYTFGPLPDNNILQLFGYDAPEGSTSPSVADGFCVMVKPLSVGEHTIHWGGTLDLSSVGGPMFIQDITYHITIAPPAKR